MADLPDVSTWFMATEKGIPYKLMNGYPRGSLELDGLSLTEKYIIRTFDFRAFLLESFAMPRISALGLVYSRPRSMPGLPASITRRISFEPLESSLPGDPFYADARNAGGVFADTMHESYAKYTVVTIEYSTGEGEDGGNSFLTVSSRSTAEFLNATSKGNMAWGYPGNTREQDDDNTQNIPESQWRESQRVTDPTTPTLEMVPTTEWVVNWNFVPEQYYRGTLLPLMKSCVGCVNSTTMLPLLYDALPETMLFVSHSHHPQYSWLGDLIAALPGLAEGGEATSNTYVKVSMQFVEKAIVVDRGGGVTYIAGHNHAWKPGEGWTRLYRKNRLPLYTNKSLNVLFPLIS